MSGGGNTRHKDITQDDLGREDHSEWESLQDCLKEASIR